MKLHANNHNVVSSNVLEKNKFSIEASSKAFMILSDGLYSNKILAVVRELSTNAYDAHVDAGCPEKPFSVHLPTIMNPRFEVRDYGVGMTHEECMTLYTTYFRSTKNDSNDAVGCLGLGSKAPFAYADSFTVEAYLDGEKRVYAAHRGDDGSPNFALLSTSETNEPRGIKVSMPVKADDFNKFQREAENVYTHFKTVPNIVNGECRIPEPDVLLKGNNWEIVRTSNHEPVAVMGQVAYGFNYSDTSEGRHDKIADFVESTSGLIIHVEIGDLDITPSRESLSFNPQTKAKLRNIVSELIKDLTKNLTDQVQSEPTLYDARVKYVVLTEQSRSIAAACQALDNITYNGERLFPKLISHTVPVSRKVRMASLSRYSRNGSKLEETQTMRIGKALYYIADTKGSITRFRNKCKELRNTYNTYETAAYLIQEDDLAAICQDLGGMPIDHPSLKRCSDLPKPERSSGGFASGSSGEVQTWNFGSDYQLPETISVKETVYYIPSNRGRFSGRVLGCSDICYYFKRRINALRKLGLLQKSSKIVLLPPSFIRNRNVEDRKNFIQLNDGLIIAEANAIKSSIELSANTKQLLKVKENHVIGTLKTLGAEAALSSVSQGIISFANEAKSDNLLTSDQLDALNFCGVTVSNKKDYLDDVLQDVWKTFPMLKIADWGRHQTEKMEIIKEYVEMCLDKMTS